MGEDTYQAGPDAQSVATMYWINTAADPPSIPLPGETWIIAVAPSAVPEPSSLMLGCLALVSLGIFACARHRFQRCAA
jgi:hypothetical protein